MSQSDFVTRGQALVSAGQYQEAVKVCRLGLLGRPTTVEGRVVLGQALLALKRHDEVLAEMRVALELDPTAIAAQVLKGEALLRKGDPHAAVETLQKVRTLAPTDPRVAQLLAEAERAAGGRRVSASHPAVGFVGGASHPAEDDLASDNHTKHYPNHRADEEDTSDDGKEETGDGYTRPTTLSQPTAKRRSQVQPVAKPRSQAQPAAAPLPAALGVGDHSGTVEVDPELEGVEIDDDDDDFDDIAAPPSSGVHARAKPGPARGAAAGAASKAAGRSGKPADRGGKPADRGGKPAARPAVERPSPEAARQAARAQGELSAIELDDDELVELEDSVSPMARGAPKPGAYTAVRNAINQPSGPMPDPAPLPTAASLRATQHQAAQAPPQLAQLIANQPHIMHIAPVPPAPAPVNPRSAIAAALPTQAAVPLPQPLFPAASVAAAARQTVVAAPHPAAMPLTAPPDARTVAPWAGAGGAEEPAYDPRAAAVADASGASALPAAEPSTAPARASRASRSGGRKGRSRWQLVLWLLVGALMIGGGVFAGFQIRDLRLGKQIAAARAEAATLAGADTWQGWSGARNRLASIAQAQGTLENRAALARARAVVAFEFGDGLAEAQPAAQELAGQGGLDGELAAAFVALAQSDARAAGAAADRALGLAPGDPAALYASGQAALLAGDLKLALASLRAAVEKEPRAMYAAGLARAHAAATAWDDGLAATEQALKAAPDHPGALLVRAALLAQGGRILPKSAAGAEIRGKLDGLVREGSRPLAEQPRGVSPMQVALAHLGLALVDAAQGNTDAARADLGNAAKVGFDEQRFAESAAEVLYAINLLGSSRRTAENALTRWPGSLRARVVLAQVALGLGKPAEALDQLAKLKDLAPLPAALAVRGAAKLAAGDLDGARADLDAALKRAPRLELALVARVRLDVRAREIDEAKKRIEPLWKAGAASPALAAAYAHVLRATGDPALRERARGAVEKLAGGALVDSPLVQLELGRILRDLNDLSGARGALQDAGRGGNAEARLEAALIQIDELALAAGRQAIDELVKEAGDRVPPALLIEATRARMLAGDHAGAQAAITQLEKLPDTVAWQLDRERGRLAIRRADYAGAGQVLLRALESCGDDPETFLLAAEVAGADKQPKLVERLQALTRTRLKGRPEEQIIAGKLAIAEGKNADAERAYDAATAALDREKASSRRRAQAAFGRAVVFYNKQDDMSAKNALEYTIALDPSIFAAHLYLADLVRERAPDKAFDHARQAVTYNPDSVEGWSMYGALAHRLRKRDELAAAITRINELAPGSEALRQLQVLR